MPLRSLIPPLLQLIIDAIRAGADRPRRSNPLRPAQQPSNPGKPTQRILVPLLALLPTVGCAHVQQRFSTACENSYQLARMLDENLDPTSPLRTDAKRYYDPIHAVCWSR